MQSGVISTGLNTLTFTATGYPRSGSIKINKTVENKDGNKVTFEGELAGPELDHVIEVGLNFLMYANLLPMLVKKPDNEELH